MKEIKTDKYIIRIHTPEITAEKAAFQMKLIQKAAENLLKSKERKRIAG